MSSATFRKNTANKKGFITIGPPSVNKALVNGPDQEVLETILPEKEPAKVQPYGTGTKRFIDMYKQNEAATARVMRSPAPSSFYKSHSESEDWYTIEQRKAYARRIMRSFDLQKESDELVKSIFTSSPGPILPTGQAAITAYADFSLVTAALARQDFTVLVRPENVFKIVRGVTYGVSTPLFSAFVQYLNTPVTGLLQPQIDSRAIFIDLVRRAVIQNNPTRAWSDFVGSSAAPAAVPVAMPVTMDSKPVNVDKSTSGIG